MSFNCLRGRILAYDEAPGSGVLIDDYYVWIEGASRLGWLMLLFPCILLWLTKVACDCCVLFWLYIVFSFWGSWALEFFTDVGWLVAIF